MSRLHKVEGLTEENELSNIAEFAYWRQMWKMMHTYCAGKIHEHLMELNKEHNCMSEKCEETQNGQGYFDSEGQITK